ncbi:GNAT family N-acetyltransferase [Chloroflexota bacterium]
MSNDIEGLIRINKSDVKPAVEVLVKAFRNYALLEYYYPDEVERDKIAYYFLSFIVSTGINYGKVYATSPNLEGIAVWMPSASYPVTFRMLVRSVSPSVIFGLGMHGSYKMKSAGEYMDAVHQRLTPFKHCFLQTIGIAPQFQGEGYAGKLLRPVLSKIDGEGLPCYLETLDEKNVSIYEHFGFKTVDKSDIPKTSLTNWAMLREAR